MACASVHLIGASARPTIVRPRRNHLEDDETRAARGLGTGFLLSIPIWTGFAFVLCALFT